ncbi:unnamed protein product [marine sediment metagenome]|uniref:Uncharacterized protein n=1 Tax=marine sediment metagenome TaxID=412755 RepID=X1CKB6_9ZZZZ
MIREKITEGCFFLRSNVDRQLLKEKNVQHMFPFLGKQIMSAIKRDKMIIPKDNFIADIYVRFMTEEEYDNKKYPFSCFIFKWWGGKRFGFSYVL